jgi:hypothetical protein
MQRLEDLGEARAKSAQAWDIVVSPYVRPANIDP